MHKIVFDFAFYICTEIFDCVLWWFEKILNATGTFDIWIGIVVFVAVFSIVVLPLRGGADLSRGALGSFLMNKVNRHKRHDD